MTNATTKSFVEAGYGRAVVADFALARVAGTSATLLEKFVFRETVRHIDEVLSCEAELANAALEVEAILFRLVPQLDHDRDLRRRALALKRSVHNQRRSAGTADDVAAIGAILKDDEPLRLADWNRLALCRESAMTEAENAYREQLAAVSRVLPELMADPALQQGLAIASPDLLSDLLRNPRDDQQIWIPSTKRSRSCTAYLTRVAMKTSPLSTFTQIGVARVVSGRPGSIDGQNAGTSTASYPTRLLRAFPHEWLMISARIRELAPAFQYEANAGIDPTAGQQGQVRVLKSVTQFSSAHFWRTEVISQQQLDESLRAALSPGRRFSYADLLDLAESHGAADQHGFFLSLVDRKLIQPVAPYSRKDPRPLMALAGALTITSTERAIGIAELMRRLQKHADAGGAASGTERIEIIAEIRRLAAAIYQALDATPPAWLNSAKPLAENVAYEGAPITLPASVQLDLARAAEKFRAGTVRTKLYDYIYQYFVRRFGEQGETGDILGFLADFLAREDFPELLARAIAEDKLAVKEPGSFRSHLPGGASAVPPTLTLFYQLAARDRDALERGRYELMINQVNSGEGGLLGRFVNIGGSVHDVLRTELAGWLKDLYRGQLPLELTVCGDINILQMEQGICGRVLQWPGELPAADSDRNAAVRLDQLRLRATSDGTLCFIDAEGRPVTVSYQGVVPSYLAPQVLRLLMVIVDPWTRDYDLGKSECSGNEQGSNHIRYFPRQQDGRIVFRRARWRVPSSAFIHREKGERDFDFFLRVQRWRTEHGLPEEVFAQLEQAQAAAQAKERKPVWVHFGSPHAIELLCQLGGADSVVTLTEVLPARSHQWVLPNLENTDSDRRASEFMSLIRWPMPQLDTRDSTQEPKSVRSMPPYADDWLYFKIYPSHPGQLDQVVREIVAPAIERARSQAELKRWFFIRYVDERGWHVRLRLQGSKPARECWLNELPRVIETALPHLSVPAAIDSHFIPVRERAPIRAAEPGYTCAKYEPEFEKYGGVVGLRIAEELFEASSELTLEALAKVHACADYRTLVLALDRTLVWHTQGSPSARERFLTQYLWYWSGQDRPGANQFRSKVLDAAARRQGLLAERLSCVATDSVINSLVCRFEQHLRLALAKLKSTNCPLTESPDRLAFDYLHMNNNRLGVSPTEEAYIAALLLENATTAVS